MSAEWNYSKDERGVGVLTLKRPAARNAIGWDLLEGLLEQVGRCAEDSSLRVFVLTATGDKAFCAGADLKERKTYSEAKTRTFVRRIGRLTAEIGRLPMPSIAAINGHAFGGGCELALACDLRVMASGYQIGLTETALAIIPGAGGTQRLPRIVGLAKAKELIFTAARLSSEQALEIGLVNALGDDAMQLAEGLVEGMLRCGPLALRSAKSAIEAGFDTGLEEGLRIEQTAYQVIIPTEDRLEALAAFAEKRAPRFKGR
jgi:enoyl-CoA hydratase/carnithine racemase